jgi:membrane protease YdiL (CAAX protease family)
MSSPETNDNGLVPPDAEPRAEASSRGHPIIAWVVILSLAVSAVALQHLRAEEVSETHGTGLVLMQLQARYLVGWHEMLPMLAGTASGAKAPDDLAKQAEVMNSGSPEQRLAAIIVIAEMREPDAALARLHDFDRQRQRADAELTPDEARLRDVLGALYGDLEAGKKDAPSLTDEDRAFLEEQLGWFGRLAVTQIPDTDKEARAAVRQPAIRTALMILAVFAAAFFLSAVGLIGLFVFLVQFLAGRLAPGLAVPSGRGGIYAETFAIWMLVYMVLGIGAALVPIPGARLLLGGTAMLVSLPITLAWPVLRGIPWATVREDVGLTAGRSPWLEPPLGVAAYVMALPMMAVGLLITLFLLHLQGGQDSGFRPTSMPSHPIVDFLARPNWGLRLQVIFLASFVAPLVEETMFRGVLYYHLRDAGWRLSRPLAVLLAGGTVSLLFAAIHPQGLTTIPPLMALAFAFTLIREWRGTLVPAMIAHGINNGAVTLLLMVALGD